VTIQKNRNLVIARGRKGVVDVVNSGAEIVDMNEFGRNFALRSSDGNPESLSSDGLEVVGLGLGSDCELEVLNESVFVGGSFFDVDGVRRFGDGVVLEGDVDGVFAVFGGFVGDVVRTVVVVDDLGGNIGVRTDDLDFEGITSFAHVVAIAIAGLDVEEGGLGVVNIFETRSPDQRVGGVRSGFDGHIVRGVLDVVEEEGFLGVEDDVDSVVSGIDGLVVHRVGTIVVVDDLGRDFVSDRVKDLGVNGMSSLGEGLSLGILRDDGEGGGIGGISSFQTRSIDVEFGRIGVGIAAVDIDVPWAALNGSSVEGDFDFVRTSNGGFVFDIVGTVVVVGKLGFNI